VTIASFPSTLSPGLAPPGKALVHAYTAGNEPYELWEGLDRRSPEYKRLKARRPRAAPVAWLAGVAGSAWDVIQRRC